MRALMDEATIELGPYGGVVRLRRRLGAREDGFAAAPTR
jgi:hypothetical protein